MFKDRFRGVCIKIYQLLRIHAIQFSLKPVGRLILHFCLNVQSRPLVYTLHVRLGILRFLCKVFFLVFGMFCSGTQLHECFEIYLNILKLVNQSFLMQFVGKLR